MILDFLNKNMYRKYPIQGDCATVSTIGVTLPTNLITSLRITLPPSISSLYIKKVNVVNNFVAISLADYANDEEIGACYGFVNTLFANLPFVARAGVNASGFVSIGEIPPQLLPEAVLWFTKEQTKIEPSCIVNFEPPEVVKLVDEQGGVCTGSVSTALENLTVSSDTNTFTLQIVNKALTSTNADFSGVYRNCNLPVITHINTVAPDENGNIDIFGILPLNVTVDSPSSEVVLTTDLVIGDVCPDLNKISPPTNTSTTYYTDILATQTPEWKTWPQYAT